MLFSRMQQQVADLFSGVLNYLDDADKILSMLIKLMTISK